MVKRPPAQDGTDDNEVFLQRWSRRKAAARNDTREAEAPQGNEPLDELQAHTAPGEPEPPPKTDADMPPIESIDACTDMRDFFSPNVSEKLRRLALRKLFHLPQFNIVDGLDDYDDDYTTFEALGDIVTADMRHQMELEKERLTALQADGAADQGADDSGARTPAGDPQEDAPQEVQTGLAEQGEAGQQNADSHDLSTASTEYEDDYRDSG